MWQEKDIYGKTIAFWKRILSILIIILKKFSIVDRLIDR